MHNLHYVVVMAKTGKAACEEAESQLEDWGDENNWRHMCGAVSQDDEVYVGEQFLGSSGRWPPESNSTIKRINEEVLHHIVQNKRALRVNLGKAVVKGLRHLDWAECYSLEKGFSSWGAITTLNSILKKEGRVFSVLTDDLRHSEFDEYGVTNLISSQEKPVRGAKKWVVFVDMHS